MRDEEYLKNLIATTMHQWDSEHGNKMNISDKGIEFIKKHEGCVLNAYLDAGGLKTIGYGHTGSDFDMTTVWTQEQADDGLKNDLVRFIACVNECVDVDITQNQFDALCSFCFNLGCLALRNSTLLRILNNENYDGAANEFLKWDHVHHMPNKGLHKRREDERKLFLSEE